MEVLLPLSPDEAAQAFGDGDGVTVVGGGTIVVPEITHGRLRPGRVLMLGRSGLDGVSRAGGMVTIGRRYRSRRSRTATSRSLPPRDTSPIREIRGQATRRRQSLRRRRATRRRAATSRRR